MANGSKIYTYKKEQQKSGSILNFKTTKQAKGNDWSLQNRPKTIIKKLNTLSTYQKT